MQTYFFAFRAKYRIDLSSEHLTYIFVEEIIWLTNCEYNFLTFVLLD